MNKSAEGCWWGGYSASALTLSLPVYPITGLDGLRKRRCTGAEGPVPLSVTVCTALHVHIQAVLPSQNGTCPPLSSSARGHTWSAILHSAASNAAAPLTRGRLRQVRVGARCLAGLPLAMLVCVYAEPLHHAACCAWEYPTVFSAKP